MLAFDRRVKVADEHTVRNGILPVFAGVWGLLAVGGFFLFYVSKNAVFKRKYFQWFAGLTGLVFVAFATATGIPVAMLAILVPFVALLTYLHIRATQFCTACGRTLVQQIPFSRADFCSKCGSPLRDKRELPRA